MLKHMYKLCILFYLVHAGQRDTVTNGSCLQRIVPTCLKVLAVSEAVMPTL